VPVEPKFWRNWAAHSALLVGTLPVLPTIPTRRPRPLYEHVAAQICDIVEQAGLGIGDRLPTERGLAARLGVSRVSVRQALAVLRSTGVVETRQGDGAYLRRSPGASSLPGLPRSGQTLPRIMEVREALETHLARLAARRRSERDLVALRAAIDEMASAIDRGDDPSHADARFHVAVARAADNAMLEELMAQLAEPIARTREASLSRPDRPPQSLEGHRRILSAIENRNEEGASAAMREHLSLVADVAHQQVDQSRA
jgi:GntR family transcriptional repressor for pyruvate dehydrogenase complex